MSDAVDEHLDKAFASLNELTVRELRATAEALERQRNGLRRFAAVFRGVADARMGGWDTDLARFHLSENVSRADDALAAQIAEAEAPFWRHVREAVRVRRATA